jgi:hypothetical protein
MSNNPSGFFPRFVLESFTSRKILKRAMLSVRSIYVFDPLHLVDQLYSLCSARNGQIADLDSGAGLFAAVAVGKEGRTP